MTLMGSVVTFLTLLGGMVKEDLGNLLFRVCLVPLCLGIVHLDTGVTIIAVGVACGCWLLRAYCYSQFLSLSLLLRTHSFYFNKFNFTISNHFIFIFLLMINDNGISIYFEFIS
jgi:hypothetical protein